MLKGPQEYRPLPAILFNSCERAIGVCGDIKEMFHQVLIREEDRCAQRFLWRDGDSSKQPDIFEMCVMTFGAACSPSAAHHVKIRNAMDHRNDDPITTRAIKSIVDNHYVDDLVDSFDTTTEAIAIAKKVKAIHLDAGFELRDFSSSSQEVSAALDGTDLIKFLGKKEDLSTGRVLGLHWCPTTDCFSFSPKFNNVSEEVLRGDRRPTKRQLGLLANFVVGAKLVMREVWRHETSWDDPLPENIADLWEMWYKQLDAVIEYAIPRCYFRNGSPAQLQLHVFVDASENAFAAVAYWRATNCHGDVEISFICAKSKCAPLKPLSVPRLELQAAVLGTRLMQTIRDEHNLKFERCILSSDSKTVVSWVRSKHRRYKPFVQHRIAEVLAATKVSDWKWIPTKENVADEATRFNNKVDFSPAARWLYGPAFLRQNESMWPYEETITTTDQDCEEELRPRYALVTVSCEFINFNRFSSFNRLLRTTAWVIRFVESCRHREQGNNQYGLTSDNLQTAKPLLCRLAQAESFRAEILGTRSGQGVSSDSTLLQLSPYLDSDGLLPVHGRIDAASWLPADTRHPIILPPTHLFTKL
ncbi:uncharacterized protein [Eurosta solidaginis]|uniref:uncharacterized protein isoform X1 n=1 Tax=Eurosta solidaginis TaxID=178769 RepID=UPI00353068ED